MDRVHGAQGFLLVDSCIALCILSIFCSSSLCWLAQVNRLCEQSKMLIQAQCLARSTIERMKLGAQYPSSWIEEPFLIKRKSRGYLFPGCEYSDLSVALASSPRATLVVLTYGKPQ
jgi:hypothetical protein